MLGAETGIRTPELAAAKRSLAWTSCARFRVRIAGGASRRIDSSGDITSCAVPSIRPLLSVNELLANPILTLGYASTNAFPAARSILSLGTDTPKSNQ